MKPNISPILVMTGYSAAGKTTLSGIYSKIHDLDYIVHQEVVHQLAVQRGFERARYWLAKVGTKEFVRVSTEEMINKITGSGNKNGVLIDVSYGKSMLDRIKSIFPGRKLIVVSVETDEETRNLRIAQRMGGVEREVAVTERQFRDGFLYEVGVAEVIKSADIHIDNNKDMKTTIADLDTKLNLLGVDFIK